MRETCRREFGRRGERDLAAREVCYRDGPQREREAGPGMGHERGLLQGWAAEVCGIVASGLAKMAACAVATKIPVSRLSSVG